MVKRKVSPADVEQVVMQGEVIISYPDDRPFPSSLLMLDIQGRPVHVLVAKNGETGECIVVTVYEADTDIWESDFRTKKNRP